jgi:hypothetical protein
MNGWRSVGMRSSAVDYSRTEQQEPRLGRSLALAKLCRMLQSTRRNYPTLRVRKRRGAYGVSSVDGTYLQVSYSAGLTASAQRDLLALLAAWLVADETGLLNQDTPPGG